MRRFCFVVLAALLILSSVCACAAQKPEPTEIPTEPTAAPTEPVETLPPVTEPPATTAPTEPPEPTIPPLGVEPGYYFDSHYSDEYEDYLDYYVHIPDNAVINMPLIVYLHGDGEVNDPHSLPISGLSHIVRAVYGEEFPFILLEPNTRVKSWNSRNIPKLLIELIDSISEQYSINTDKIILTGHSRGAMGVWNMISIYGNYFSAAVPVSSPHQKDHIEYLKASEVPVWTFAGDEGDTERWYHQYLAKNVEMITVSGGYGKFTVLEGCDHGEAFYGAFVKETFDWMLEQQSGVIPEE